MTNDKHKRDLIRQGGLMRCCLATLQQASLEYLQKNDVVHCRWCSERMRYVAGAWEWWPEQKPERDEDEDVQ